MFVREFIVSGAARVLTAASEFNVAKQKWTEKRVGHQAAVGWSHRNLLAAGPIRSVPIAPGDM